jgi:hypothetical protein
MNFAIFATIFVPIFVTNSAFSPHFYDPVLYRVVASVILLLRLSLYTYAKIEKNPTTFDFLWRKLSLNSLSYSEADKRALK